MRSEKIAHVIQLSETLSESTKGLVTFLSEQVDEEKRSFDIKKNIPTTDSSTSDVLTRIFTTTEIIGKFDRTSKASVVPLETIGALENAITMMARRVSELVTHIETLIKDNGGLRSVNYDDFHFFMENGQNANLQSPFVNFVKAAEGLISAFYSNVVILKPSKASYSFQAAASALSGMLERTEGEHDALRGALSDLKKISDEAKSLAENATVSANEAERLKQEGANDRQTISEYLAKATEQQLAISSAHEAAISLSTGVDEYARDFEAFQKKLDQRNFDFETGQETLGALIVDFEGQKKAIQALIAESEGMLKSATVAGLASHFDTIRNDLTTELKSARLAFYIGIVLLVLSALPLALMIFWPIISLTLSITHPEWAEGLKGYAPSSSQTGWQYVGQVIARFVVLVPAAWFVSFSAIRHSSLFRLREHYTYKYSMAVSVEGFKKQAKGYEDEIAALVLEQLAFNPADKLVASKDVPEGKAPNPLMRFFMAKLNKKFESLNTPPK